MIGFKHILLACLMKMDSISLITWYKQTGLKIGNHDKICCFRFDNQQRGRAQNEEFCDPKVEEARIPASTVQKTRRLDPLSNIVVTEFDKWSAIVVVKGQRVGENVLHSVRNCSLESKSPEGSVQERLYRSVSGKGNKEPSFMVRSKASWPSDFQPNLPCSDARIFKAQHQCRPSTSDTATRGFDAAGSDDCSPSN